MGGKPRPKPGTQYSLHAIDWTSERTEELRKFLLLQKHEMIHCDEKIGPSGLCACMLHLARWWVAQEKGRD